MRYHEIFEGRDAPLYHGTSTGLALMILKTDCLAAKSGHILHPSSSWERRRENEDETVNGVSLTRSQRLARDFGPVVFTLDQTRLRHNHRIVPVDYWGHSRDPILMGSGRRQEKYAEAEEFVIGDIKPLSRYLVALGVCQQRLDRIDLDFSPDVRKLISHPLFSAY